MGGSGSRFGGPLPKQFCRFIDVASESEQLPLFAETLQTFLDYFHFDVITLAVHPDYIDSKEFTQPLHVLKQRFPLNWVITEGGSSRHHSFRKAFSALSREIHKAPGSKDFRVVVHDANRPFLRDEFLEKVKTELGALSEERPAAIPVIAMADSVVKVQEGAVKSYEKRDVLARVQTPQLFWGASMAQALSKSDENEEFSDEGSFMLKQGFGLYTFDGDVKNRKITFQDEAEQV